MAKLTKEQVKRHERACAVLEQDRLSLEDRFFVAEHWLPYATSMARKTNAFFTPMDLAADAAMCAMPSDPSGVIIDLCAGTGTNRPFHLNPLTYAYRDPARAHQCQLWRQKAPVLQLALFLCGLPDRHRRDAYRVARPHADESRGDG